MGILQPLLGGYRDLPINTTPTYTAIQAPGEAWNFTNQPLHLGVIMPINGKLLNFSVGISSYPSNASRRFTVMLNNSATHLDFTLTGTDTSGCDFRNVLNITSGDLIMYREIDSGSISPTDKSYPSIVWAGNNGVILGGAQHATATIDGYCRLGTHVQGIVQSSTSNFGIVILPTDCVIRNLFVRVDSSPTSIGADKTFTLVKNGSETGLTVTLSGSNTSGSDITHSVSFLAGDNASLVSKAWGNTSRSVNIAFGMEVICANSSESLLFVGNEGGVFSARTNDLYYSSVVGAYTQENPPLVPNSVPHSFAPINFSAKNLYFYNSSTAGSGKVFRVLAYVNTGYPGSVQINQLNLQSLKVTVSDNSILESDNVNSFSVQKFQSLIFVYAQTNGAFVKISSGSWGHSMVINNVQLEMPMVFHDRFITEIG